MLEKGHINTNTALLDGSISGIYVNNHVKNNDIFFLMNTSTHLISLPML